jgi:hypothetical protein
MIAHLAYAFQDSIRSIELKRQLRKGATDEIPLCIWLELE